MVLNVVVMCLIRRRINCDACCVQFKRLNVEKNERMEKGLESKVSK